MEKRFRSEPYTAGAVSKSTLGSTPPLSQSSPEASAGARVESVDGRAWIEEKIPLRIRLLLAIVLAAIAVLLVALNYNPISRPQPGVAAYNDSSGLGGPYGLPSNPSGAGGAGVVGFLIVLGVVLVYFLFIRGPRGRE